VISTFAVPRQLRRFAAAGCQISEFPVQVRTRKLVGTIILLVFLAIYALAAMLVAVALQVNGSKTAEVIYYVVAGLLWVLPAAWLIKWMQKPDDA
jgi:hypothetical protein